MEKGRAVGAVLAAGNTREYAGHLTFFSRPLGTSKTSTRAFSLSKLGGFLAPKTKVTEVLVVEKGMD